MAEIKEFLKLAPYTTFKIGGKARYFSEAKNKEDIKELLKFAKKQNIPYFILGKGSDMLISDSGFSGLVILNRLTSVKKADPQNAEISASSGLANAEIVKFSIENNFSGLEWLATIPGTLGGAIWANAGSFGNELKDFIKEVEIMNLKTGENLKLSNADCGFSYRDSIFKKNPEFFILEAILKLKKGEADNSKKLMLDYLKKRNETQDMEHLSAGCVFKNIPWSRKDIKKKFLIKNHPELSAFTDKPTIPAGFLIDFLGLKGRTIGGASISLKHGNFIINEGSAVAFGSGATAEDVIMLISLIKDKIYSHYGIALEEEIQYLGF